MKFLKNLFFGKELHEVLNETKTVKAGGVRFKIKRLNVTNHLEGINVLLETYATYERKREVEKLLTSVDSEDLINKTKRCYRDIFLASVIEPKLTPKQEDSGQFVDALFDDWQMCHELYAHIMDYSTNKKKIKNSTYHEVSYTNLI